MPKYNSTNSSSLFLDQKMSDAIVWLFIHILCCCTNDVKLEMKWCSQSFPQNVQRFFKVVVKGTGVTSSCSSASSTPSSLLCFSHPPPSPPSSRAPSSSLMAMVLIGWAVSTSPADGGRAGGAKCEERLRESSDTVEKTRERRRIWSFASNQRPHFIKALCGTWLLSKCCPLC